MNWQPDDDGYSDGNWCPDCGLPREVCTCHLEGVGDWYEDGADDGDLDYDDYDDDGYEPPEVYGDH